MRAKITLPALVTMLSRESGMSKKVAEEFVREFCSLIISALETDRIVKIKSLGTFKLISVEPRKSVDVNTGEDTLIAGHSKITFVASKELASRVNLPFEAFEPVEIEAGVVFGDVESPEPSDSEDEKSTIADSEEFEEIEENHLVEDERQVYSEAADSIYNMDDGVEKEIEAEEENYEMMRASEEMTQPESGLDPELWSESQTDSEPQSAPELQSDSDYKSEQKSEPVSDSFSAPEAGSEPEADTSGQIIREVVVHSDYVPEDHPLRQRHKFAKGFIAGFLSCIVFFAIAIAGAYLLMLHTYGPLEKYLLLNGEQTQLEEVDQDVSDSGVVVALTEEVSPEEEENDVKEAPTAVKPVEDIKKTDEKDKVETQASDSPVYDTISQTRYLTTMAKDHYGNYNLWPYIYEENKSKLGHPDRIRPGTVVVIPSLKKYGVDPNNPADVTKAKRLGVQIYARYK